MSRFAPISRRRQAVKRTLSTLALAAAAAACFAPVVDAKTYKVYACKGPDGTAIPLDRTQWTRSIMQAYSTAEEACAAGYPMALFMGSPGAGTYGPGRAAQWSLRSPMPIVGARVWRSVTTKAVTGDFSATPEYQAAVPGRGVIDACAADGCQIGAPNVWAAPENLTQWTFSSPVYDIDLFVHCGGGVGSSCVNQGSERVIAAFHRLEFEVSDTDLPTIEANSVGGTLLESTEQRGKRSLGLRASDWGSGIYEFVVSLDGQRIGDLHPLNEGKCTNLLLGGARGYRDFKPCTNAVTLAEFEIDSAQYTDGPHRLRVDVVDAAGNSRNVRDQEVRFANAPRISAKPTIAGSVSDPRPNDTLTASPGAWDGGGFGLTYQWQRSDAGVAWSDIAGAASPVYLVTKDDVDHYLRVVVTATNSAGSSSVAADATAKVKTGETLTPDDFGGGPSPTTPKGGGGDVSTAQLVVDREQRTVEVKYGSKIVITGRLVDADGQPIADADVDVYEQLVLTAAPWQKIGTVKTDSQGGYVFRPQTTASRRLRFAFADRRDVANYRATREVLVSVQAAMSISAKRKVVGRGGTIRLRGRVTVDNLPKTGTWVEVQVLDAGLWRTVATRKTSSKGLWTFKHRLRQSAGVTFRFRSRLRAVGDVASAEAKSLPVKVRIR